MTEPQDVDATVKRIESLLAEPAGSARDAVRLLMDLYGAGLTRIVDALPPDLLARLSDDKLVGSLLLLHDLHPESAEVRVRRALESIEWRLDGPRLALTEITDGVARVCMVTNGTAKLPPDVQASIERAVVEWAPEIERVVVTGIPHELVQIAPAAPVAPFPSRDRQGAVGSADRCELCGAALVPAHGHVLDLEHRRILCSCRPCYLLFTETGAAGGKFRSVPERFLQVSELARAPWDALDIPVGMAFFLRQASTNRITAFYPSPAGATESTLPLDTWGDLLQVCPTLETLDPDVEALLISRKRDPAECWIVPVASCYELVGRIRRHWHGFHGGDDAWREIDSFFDSLREREETRSGAWAI
jgi:hypothetical protein